MTQRSTTHVSERRQFNDMALHQAAHPLKAQHLVKRVIQRPKEGVDFLPNVTRQKSQALPCLNRRTNQYDSIDRFLGKRLYRTSNCQVGLAGAGRSDTEVDIVPQNVSEIALLVRALAPDHGLANPDDHIIGSVLIVEALSWDLADRNLDLVGAQRCAIAAVRIERTEHVLRIADILILTINTKEMPTMGDAHTKPLLYLLEVSVVLSTQVGQALIVLGIEKEGDGLGGVVQSSTDAPSEASVIIAEVVGMAPSTSARKELGNASVIRTSTKSPIETSPAAKLTTRLFSVRPLRYPAFLRETPSTKMR